MIFFWTGALPFKIPEYTESVALILIQVNDLNIASNIIRLSLNISDNFMTGIQQNSQNNTF
jgi:hypothetical protein